MPTVEPPRSADRTDVDRALPRPLVLCADDFAVHAPASAGIVELARRQRLSATSVMTLSPRWAGDAAPLRELRDRLDVGLHLDFTSPMARAAGVGRSLGGMMWRTLWPVGRALTQQWRDAIERQCEAFEQHWRDAPDHVDGHQHVQQFAGLRELVLEVLQRRYPQRPWLRVSQVAQPDVKAAIITRWGAHAWRRQLQAAGWRGLTPLRGAYDFNGGLEAYAQRMRQWLSQARQDGGLIMCHPAQTVDAEDPIGAARAWEYAYLASDAFAHDLSVAGVHLVRGSALHFTS
jgi:predicted glycoside hydrolase/deacetylase ChbG (UPF0249 family)